jgi:hemolysin-activating ACP:hemolysin acyltransferase
MHDYDAITKRAVFRNVDTRPCSGNDVNICSLAAPVGNSKVVQKASSVTVDFERVASSFHLVHLSGRYDNTLLLWR